jgi:hypothetical protein
LNGLRSNYLLNILLQLANKNGILKQKQNKKTWKDNSVGGTGN